MDTFDNIDYDDRPPLLTDEDDPRQPDEDAVRHDQQVRENQQREHAMRGQSADVSTYWYGLVSIV